MKIIAIIPARGGSKRLPSKNIYLLNNKPLISYTIDACKNSKYINEVFVSSDNDEILEVSMKLGAQPLLRPSELADDKTPKIIAIRQAVQMEEVNRNGKPDVVVIPQANSPQIKSSQLDGAIEMMQKHSLWEVMSTDANGVQNAAFRVVKYDALFNEFLSAHCGFIVAENIDVHTLQDIEKLENKQD